MKYGYIFHDWGLYDIVGFESVEDLTEDLNVKDPFGTHTFKKEDYCLVTMTPEVAKSFPYRYKVLENGNIMSIFYKKHIFNSKEEAEEYGKKNSSCIIY